jgi:hypothetical protein
MNPPRLPTDLRHSSLCPPTSSRRSCRSSYPVTRSTRRENLRSAHASQPQPFMTKLHPLLHAPNRARACTSWRFSLPRGAKPVNFADKKWDPYSAHKMQPQVQQRLTSLHEKTRPTKFKNPRACRYLVRTIGSTARQNSTSVVCHFPRHSGFLMSLQYRPVDPPKSRDPVKKGRRTPPSDEQKNVSPSHLRQLASTKQPIAGSSCE